MADELLQYAGLSMFPSLIQTGAIRFVVVYI